MGGGGYVILKSSKTKFTYLSTTTNRLAISKFGLDVFRELKGAWAGGCCPLIIFDY